MVGRETWSAQAVDDLTKYHAEGLSRSKIASRMKITIGSVCGKINRLGLAGSVVHQPVKRRKPAAGVAPRAPRRARCVVLVHPTARTIMSGAGQNISLLMVGPHDCRAIVGRGDDGIAICCGNTRTYNVHGRPSWFCAQHHAVFYQRAMVQ